jgi:hypothetical protein
MAVFVELRTALQTYLKTLHDRVYFQVAPDNATMPYVVFDLPNSIDSGALENFVLDIDFWDDSTDTTILETLASVVDVAMHKHTILVNNVLGTAFYRDSRITLVDEDPRIRRRKYTYQARTYQNY